MRLALINACLSSVLLAGIGLSGPAFAASAVMKDAQGNVVGNVALETVPSGVLVTANFKGFVPGAHAFHVHAVGLCEPPFKSAGGHYNPSTSGHGLKDEHMPHVGDMPNIHVGADGTLTVEILNTQLALNDSLFDADGAAIVVHAGPDDYASDPAGAAGGRIACGVIQK